MKSSTSWHGSWITRLVCHSIIRELLQYNGNHLLMKRTTANCAINSDPPKVSPDNVEALLNMEQVDGLQNSPERLPNGSLRGTPPVPRRSLSFLILSTVVLTNIQWQACSVVLRRHPLLNPKHGPQPSVMLALECGSRWRCMREGMW